MIKQIQRTRLGGVDRIVLDMEPGEPLTRYAHIMENGGFPTLHTTNDPHRADDAYDESWKRVGVIDLDTGEVVDD